MSCTLRVLSISKNLLMYIFISITCSAIVRLIKNQTNFFRIKFCQTRPRFIALNSRRRSNESVSFKRISLCRRCRYTSGDSDSGKVESER